MFPAQTRTLPKYWSEYPTSSTHIKVSLIKRIWGPMYSHRGYRLGIVGRLLYGWLYTDDPYFERVDQELKEKGL